MSTKTQRINVTLDVEDLEIVQILSRKKKMSMSSIIKEIVIYRVDEGKVIVIVIDIDHRKDFYED